MFLHRVTTEKSIPTNALLLAVASVALTTGLPVHAAAEPSMDELKAEIARLKKALEARESTPDATEPLLNTPDATGASGNLPGETQAETPPSQEEPKALGEVVVRRSRGLSTKHDLPTSASVITGQQLEETGAYNLSDFSKRSANLSRDTGNPRTLSLAIRGIGRKGITEAQDPSVLTSADGLSFAYNSLATWDFVDVESVEVTRGPGGTLGGKNYSLGQVNITTRDPSFTQGGRYAMRFGLQDTFYGDASYGGAVIDDLLAWRGTFFVHKQAGVYQNDYDLRGRTYIDTNKISGRAQFLLTPSENFTARLSVDVQPRTAENFNGLNFFHQEPATYTNGNGWNRSATAFNRLQRGWFGQKKDYGLSTFYNIKTGTQNNDSQLPLETGMNGVVGDLRWKLGSHTLTSISGWKDFWFDARNDEGTPFDITLQSGGGVRYEQFSQELRLASAKGGFLDYVTGLYYITTRTDVDAKTGWGSDAGAWFAGGNPNLVDAAGNAVSTSVPITVPAYTKQDIDPYTGQKGISYGGAYGRLSADGAGRYLMSNALDGLQTLGRQRIRNQSPAWYGNVNWHFTDALTLNTGLRTTYEDRTTEGFKLITNQGYAQVLNPGVSSFGEKLGGFDAIYNGAPTAGSKGYFAQNAKGLWKTYNYNEKFDPAVDVNTYVLDNRIVQQEDWVKAGKPATATGYATNDAFYTNGRKLGLGTDVSTASTQPGQSDITQVAVSTTALTTDKANYAEALEQANLAALRYFGKKTTTDATTGVTIQAWDQLSTAQKRQIADAQNLRKGQLGPIYNTVRADPFRKLQLTSIVSPLYKIDENLTAYATWQHGEKAGIAQITNGVSTLAKPEITESYEIGLKSYLFDKTLTLNSDIFFTDISDYQQAVQVLDEYTTGLINDGTLYWTNATLNADRVNAFGVELDATYTGLPGTALRFAGAYNDAWYASFKNAPLPPEIDPATPDARNSPFRDLTGRTLPGAARFSFNVGGEYRHPVFDKFEAHTALNYAFQTGYNADVTLSKYSWVNGYGVADFAVGLGRSNRNFDVNFLVRNLFDTRPIAETASSGVLQTAPRWYGVVVSGQF